MNINLLDLLKQIFGGDFSALAARLLGESETNTKSAVGAMLPALLGAIVQKGSTPDGASNLFGAINSPHVDTGLTGNISQLLSSGGAGTNSLLSAGSGLLSSLLGPKAGPLTGALSSMSGLSGNSASSLLSLAAPLIFAALKKLIGEHGLNPSSLMSLLSGQSKTLESALDPRLSQAMGLKLPNVGHAASAAADTASAGAGKLLPWIIAAIAALIAFWLFRSCSADAAQKTADAAKAAAATAAAATSDAAKAAKDAAAATAAAAAKKTADAAQAAKDAAAATAKKTADAAALAMRTITLPSGERYEVRVGGFIDSLFSYLERPDWAPGRKFAFDSLTFETNSATLTPVSNTQMTQLASVLKLHPTVLVVVEGHTDNTGDPAANKKLSEDRAAAVKAVLVGMGFPAERVTSGGWGQEKPVASNETEDGKAKNRRVEITLTKK